MKDGTALRQRDKWWERVGVQPTPRYAAYDASDIESSCPSYRRAPLEPGAERKIGTAAHMTTLTLTVTRRRCGQNPGVYDAVFKRGRRFRRY